MNPYIWNWIQIFIYLIEMLVVDGGVLTVLEAGFQWLNQPWIQYDQQI